MGLFKQRQPPEPPKLETPPAVKELEDVIDEISGTEAITVKGADGKKRRVVRRLPRTGEEEALFQKGQVMMKTALQNITNLYQYDPTSAIDFQPIINTFANINSERMNNLSQIADFGNIKNDIDNFKEMQSSLLKEQFLTENNRLNERLAHSGLEDSTVGREERNLLSRNQNLTSRQADLNALEFGEGLADRRLNRNANLYNMNEMGRQSRLQAAQLEYDLAQKKQADLEQLRQNAITENQNQLQIGSNLLGNDLDRSMKTRANTDALNQMQIANSAQMNRYNADVNRLTQQHQMQMNQFNARPPSFGDFAMRLGGMGVGYALGGPAGAKIGGDLMSRGK